MRLPWNLPRVKSLAQMAQKKLGIVVKEILVDKNQVLANPKRRDKKSWMWARRSEGLPASGRQWRKFRKALRREEREAAFDAPVTP